MRSIANATISFGRVDIPVRVYATVESKSKIEFKLLHERCKSRLKQQHYCPTCKCDVERDEMVRGFEFAKDRYAILTTAELEELDQAEDPQNQRITITGFINGPELLALRIAQIEHCYFVGPDQGDDRAFATLVRAMMASRTDAVAKYTTRGRTHQVLLTFNDDRLEMLQLRRFAELRPITEVPTFDVAPAHESVALAEQLIAELKGDVADLTGYVDEQEQRRRQAVQEKIDAGEIAVAPTPAQPEPIADVVDALKASLKPKKKERRMTPAP